MSIRKIGLSDVIVAVVLGLGFSACIVFWAVYSPFYLDPTPGLDGERIVYLFRHGRSPAERTPFASAELDALRSGSKILDSVGAFETGRPASVRLDRLEQVVAARVDADFLRVFNCRLAEGAPFGKAPSQRDLLIGAAFRDTRLGGRAPVTGESIIVDGETRTVVGVLEPVDWPRAVFPDPPELFLPLSDQVDADQPNYDLVARLKDGASPAEARDLLIRVNEEIRVAFLKESLVTQVETIDELVRSEAAWFPLLFCAGFALLLGVCLNVAVLMVGRALDSLDDWAIRRALGATHWHLRRHLVKRFCPLVLMGAVIGLVMARGLLGLIVGIGAPKAFPLDRWSVGRGLIPLVLSLSSVSAIVCLFPAFLALRRADLVNLTSNRRVVVARGGRYKVIAFIQLSMSVALAVVSACVTLHYWERRSVDLGFELEGLTLARVETAPGQNPLSLQADFEELRRRLEAEPGIEGVAGSADPPFVVASSATGYFTLGPRFDSQLLLKFRQSRVTPNYFSVMRTPLEGSGFQSLDGEPGDVVVSQALADTLRGGNAPASSFIFGRALHRIVGVAGNRVADDLSGRSLPTVYYPLDMAATGGGLYLLLRSTRTESDLQRRLEAIIPQLPSQPILVSVRSMESLLAHVLEKPRFLSTVLVYLSVLILATTAIGLVASYTREMNQRARGIAIRGALGATTGRIVGQVGIQVCRLAAPAILTGLIAGGWFVSVSHELFGVENPGYMAVFAIAAGVGALISLVVLSPIVRVTRQDLSSLLRF